MTFRFTVEDAFSGRRMDAEAEGSATVTVGQVLDLLPVPLAGRPCFVGHERVDPGMPLSRSPLSAGVVLTVGAPGPRVRGIPVPGAVGVVRTLWGPDAGRVTWLPPGCWTVGRAPSRVVVVHGPGVSRSHAELLVGPSGVAAVVDRSRNGIRLGDEPVRGTAPVPDGGVLDLGGAGLQWVRAPASGVPVVGGVDGTLAFDRAFARVPVVSETVVDLPEPPEPTTRGAFAAQLGSLAVVTACGVLGAVLYRQPAMAVMSVAGPLAMVLVQVLGLRGRRRSRAEYGQRQLVCLRRISEAVAQEERDRRTAVPDLLDVLLTGLGLAPGLWHRDGEDPGALVLGVGTVDALAAVRLVGRRWPGLADPVLRGVPLTVDLREAGVIAVTGPPAEVRPLVRWLLLQVGVLCGPEQVQVVLLTRGRGAHLAWARWLPQVRGDGATGPGASDEAEVVAGLAALVRQRLATGGDAAPSVAENEPSPGRRPRGEPDVVVVLDGGLALRTLPGMELVLRRGPSVGIHSVFIDRAGSLECTVRCEVSGGQVTLIRRDGAVPVSGRVGGVDESTAERVARAVAPMRDRLGQALGPDALPTSVRLLDLVGTDVLTADGVLARWRSDPGPTTAIPLGAGPRGEVQLDLAVDGPHLMVGGAPGSGKSALLRTFVAALLLANRPDELQFVLVDFKGGSAFAPFEQCPQVAALIRSTGYGPYAFDAAAAERVLSSLRAESRRRQRLLERHEDIEHYWAVRAHDPCLPPLPRLVVVLDEFGEIREAHEGFLTALASLGRVGRALGMHLVLATQTFAGALPEELRANIDLRISLRQNEVSESREILGVPAAAEIPGTARGRGLIRNLRSGSREPYAFQCAHLSARGPRLSLPGPPLSAPDPHLSSGSEDSGPAVQGELAQVVASVCEAARRLDLPRPPVPLCPPLPPTLRLDELSDHATAMTSETLAAFALADDPEHQAQVPIGLDLTGTDRLMIAGGPQSGRTTAARALTCALVRRFDPGRVHLYLVERRSGPLRDLADLPHCGAVLASTEHDRVRRLLLWLRSEVRGRGAARTLLGDLPRDPERTEPWLILIVDGWESLEFGPDGVSLETSVQQALAEVVRDGPAVGVHVVAVGGELLATRSRLADLFSVRVLLPFPVPAVRASLVAGRTAPPVLPGRAVEATSGRHLQICEPPAGSIGPDGAAPATFRTPGSPGFRPAGIQEEARAHADGTSCPWSGPGPVRFPPLPREVSLATLQDHRSGWSAPGAPGLRGAAGRRVLLGVRAGPVRGLDGMRRDAAGAAGGGAGPANGVLSDGSGGETGLELVHLDLFEAHLQVLLATGGPGTGRTTVAATLVHGLLGTGVPVFVIAPPRSPLPSLVPQDDPRLRVLQGTTLTENALRDAARALGDEAALVVDDFESLVLVGDDEWPGRPGLVHEWASPAARGRRAVVLCGDVTPVLDGQTRSLGAVALSAVSGGMRLLLDPGAGRIAHHLGVSLEADQLVPLPPGRCYLATASGTDLVQIALPPGR